jgi:hypothetical protein
MWRFSATTSVLLVGLVCLGACGDDDGDSAAQPDVTDDAVGDGDSADAGDGSTAVTEPVCGDGVLSPSEACEGFDLRGQSCADLAYESGRLSCAADCTLDESLCVRCGDGILGGSEVCDTTVPSELSCADWLGEGATGELSCASDCSAVVADACVDPPGEAPLDTCEPGVRECAGGLSCVETEFGGVCLRACETATSCPAGEYCASVSAESRACLPQPSRGEQCASDAPCAAGLVCAPAFGFGESAVSLCSVPCAAGCGAGEQCVEVPSGQLELESDAACRQDAAGACGSGFECQDVDPDGGGVLRCARVWSLCATPQALYGFGGAGPTDAQICDLNGPTGGGRFCGLPTGATAAVATCYPIFGETEALGACIGLCDDGTAEGVADRQCPDGWTCGSSALDGLYYTQSDEAECTDEDRSACQAGFGECVDLGDGLQCARRARVCVEDAP